MKKIFAISLFLIIFESCQKEHSVTDDNYHVSFTVDGVNKTYTGHVFAHLDTIAGYIELQIVGANSTTSFDNYMGIYVNNFPGSSNITTGQYEDNSASFTLLTTYANNAIEYEAGQSVAEEAVTYNVTIANHFKVIISSLDNKSAKGTFSGDYYEDGNVQNGTRLSITNGDFYVPFQ